MTSDLDFLTASVGDDRSDVAYRQQALVLELSERVLDRISQLGISQAELARRMRVSRPMITKLLTGDSNFQLKTLLRLADALEMDFIADFVPKGFARAGSARLARQPPSPMSRCRGRERVGDS